MSYEATWRHERLTQRGASPGCAPDETSRTRQSVLAKIQGKSEGSRALVGKGWCVRVDDMGGVGVAFFPVSAFISASKVCSNRINVNFCYV